MRLDTLYTEAKSIILSPEAHAFAEQVANEIIEKVHSDETEDYQIVKDINLSDKYGPNKHVVISVKFKEGIFSQGTYWHERKADNIVRITMQIGDDLHPSVDANYIKQQLIHELTHSVDPKVQKDVPGAADYDIGNKHHDSGGKSPIGLGRINPYRQNKYIRQPIEVEVSTYQLASLIIHNSKHGKQRLLNILDKQIIKH